MSQPEPLTEQQLDEYAASVAVYRQHAPTGFACCSAHPVADAGVALLAEVRRQRAELAAVEMLAPQQCPAGLHADWLVDSEYAHACPWCHVAELEVGLNDLAALVSQWYDRAKEAEARAAELDALPDRLEAALTERYTALGNPFSRMDVHKQGPDGWPMSTPVSPNDVAGVVRELLTAPEATTAPLAASQPSEAPVEPETATRPPTGRAGDPRRTLTPNEYDAAWHAVEGAAGEEGADPGTVLHAVLDRLGIEWQDAASTPGSASRR